MCSKRKYDQNTEKRQREKKSRSKSENECDDDSECLDPVITEALILSLVLR